MRVALLLGISNMRMGAEPPGRALQKSSFLDSAVHVELWAVDCTVPAALLKFGLLVISRPPPAAATQAVAVCFVSLAGKWQDRKRCENFERHREVQVGHSLLKGIRDEVSYLTFFTLSWHAF